MIHRRIVYGLLLGAAVLFQIFYRGYLGTFFLVLLIVLPFFSLAVSLPGLLRCSLALSPAKPQVLRGETAAFTFSLHTPFPVGRAALRLTLVNRLTGESSTLRRTLSSGARRVEKAETRHCGQLECTVVRARILDLSGLFSLPLTRGTAEADLLILPRPVEAALPPENLTGKQAGAGLRPRPGGGPGEDYDLRLYRPGDPLRSVHWKLSSKWDELVVQETLEPRRPALVLTYDHFGPHDALDRTLDRLCALSRRFLQAERPHHIQWADPVSGAVHDCAVAGEGDLSAFLAQALAIPAPAEGHSILDAALKVPADDGPLFHLHVTAPEEGAAL